MTKQFLASLIIPLREILDLHKDKEEEKNIIETIRKGIEFKGTNLWILIFAIFIASIGLNINSIPVIIGAMLISPLMGPIMGLGLGIGIYDFELIKKSFMNLSLAVLISILTSTIYFLVSPLSEEQPELLARTYPTIWDVFVAFFGGLAGIIAQTRKEKTNVIPGVAIATALMPPLCTAGYGIANGKIFYFLGSFYLFFINSIFITFSTFLIIRFLKFSKINFLNVELEKRIKLYIYAIVIITIIPSFYLGYNIVQKSLFENKANSFLRKEINQEKYKIIYKNFSYEDKKIEILLVGKPLPEESLNDLAYILETNYLPGTQLIIRQALNETPQNFSNFKLIEKIYDENLETIKKKDEEIKKLTQEINLLKLNIPIEDIASELKIYYPDIKIIHIAKGEKFSPENLEKQKNIIILLETKKKYNKPEENKIKEWFKIRLKEDKILVLFKRYSDQNLKRE